MRLPLIRGVIDRRILVNYRVDPTALTRILPAPFRPKTVRGFGVAGICLIRLRAVRPRGIPPWLGLSSENAAHRVAVEWDDCGQCREGVYIPRRDTASLVNALAGGRVFPGVHRRVAFDVDESGPWMSVSFGRADGATRVAVQVRPAARVASDSVFRSTDEAAAFFRAGSVGYSPTAKAGRFEGIELRCRNWRVEPLEIVRVESSVFDDYDLFPPGSVAVDSAFLMRGVEHEWLGLPDLDATGGDRGFPRDRCDRSASRLPVTASR